MEKANDKIDFPKRCKGCKYACFENGRWQYCDIYYYSDGRKRPEPDGSGGCKHYTPGKRPKVTLWGDDRERKDKESNIHRRDGRKHRILPYSHINRKLGF